MAGTCTIPSHPSFTVCSFRLCEKVQERLQLEGLRVELDSRDEKIGYKIREAQMQKIPYMLVVGDQEAENGAVNVRKYGEQDSETMDLEGFVKHAVAEAKK